jgi:hypothetical protein
MLKVFAARRMDGLNVVARRDIAAGLCTVKSDESRHIMPPANRREESRQVVDETGRGM